MDQDKVDLSSVNKEKKQLKLPRLKNPFKKQTGPNRDDLGQFTSGSGGLINTSNFNWKRALPLMAIVALVGGFLVYRSFALEPYIPSYASCKVVWADPASNISKYPEACIVNTSDASVVRLYYGIFNRAPDKSGLKYWTDKIVAKKITLTEIARQFMGSSEFKNKYGTLSNEDFVKAMYPQVFGRDPDPSGLAYWTKKLANKSVTRQDLMVNFTQSNEMKRKFTNQVVSVMGLPVFTEGSFKFMSDGRAQKEIPHIASTGLSHKCRFSVNASDQYSSGASKDKGNATAYVSAGGGYCSETYQLQSVGMRYLVVDDNFKETIADGVRTDAMNGYVSASDKTKMLRVNSVTFVVKDIKKNVCSKYLAEKFGSASKPAALAVTSSATCK